MLITCAHARVVSLTERIGGDEFLLLLVFDVEFQSVSKDFAWSTCRKYMYQCISIHQHNQNATTLYLVEQESTYQIFRLIALHHARQYRANLAYFFNRQISSKALVIRSALFMRKLVSLINVKLLIFACDM